jgi:hypothetical protein
VSDERAPTANAARLAAHLSVWDQTVGCDLCGRAWWAENATDPLEDFHAGGCPLKGRRDAHAAWGVNYEALEPRP